MRSIDIQKLAAQSIFSAYGLDKTALEVADPLRRAGAGALSAFLPGAIAGGGLAYLTASPEEESMKARIAKGALAGGASAAALNAARHGLGQHLKNVDATKMYDADAAASERTRAVFENLFQKSHTPGFPGHHRLRKNFMRPVEETIQQELEKARQKAVAAHPVEPTLLERAYGAARDRLLGKEAGFMDDISKKRPKLLALSALMSAMSSSARPSLGSTHYTNPVEQIAVLANPHKQLPIRMKNQPAPVDLARAWSDLERKSRNIQNEIFNRRETLLQALPKSTG